jgi:large subunit ribosomal protein L13
MTQKPREGKKLINKSFMLKSADVKHGWIILDASGKTLGRFASEVAKILRGKHKPTYTPHIDCGDGVIVINADKIEVTGNKEAQKIYRKYTGFMGGMRETLYNKMKERNPEYIIERAVTGMMPKSRLADQQIRRLRVMVGEDHKMNAQQPIKVNI